jgi:hypothetical protein
VIPCFYGKTSAFLGKFKYTKKQAEKEKNLPDFTDGTMTI